MRILSKVVFELVTDYFSFRSLDLFMSVKFLDDKAKSSHNINYHFIASN